MTEKPRTETFNSGVVFPRYSMAASPQLLALAWEEYDVIKTYSERNKTDNQKPEKPAYRKSK